MSADGLRHRLAGKVAVPDGEDGCVGFLGCLGETVPRKPPLNGGQGAATVESLSPMAAPDEQVLANEQFRMG